MSLITIWSFLAQGWCQNWPLLAQRWCQNRSLLAQRWCQNFDRQLSYRAFWFAQFRLSLAKGTRIRCWEGSPSSSLRIKTVKAVNFIHQMLFGWTTLHNIALVQLQSGYQKYLTKFTGWLSHPSVVDCSSRRQHPGYWNNLYQSCHNGWAVQNQIQK